MGRLCRLAHGGRHLHRRAGARNDRRVRKPGDGGAAAAGRARRARCSAPPRCRAAPRNWRPSRGPRWAASPMRSRPALPYGADGGVLADRRRCCAGAIQLAQPAAPRGCRDAGAICSPASTSSATIRRSSARSRSICSRCCSAAPPRCCRSMRAISCRPARWGLGILRAAPAVGALLTTAILARQPISRRVGMRMFQAVIIFGVATVVFARLALDVAVGAGAGGPGRGRHRQRGDPLFAGAARHARTRCAAGSAR